MLNGIVSLEDIVPTIMAAAGVPNVKEQLLDGYQAGDKHFRVQVTIQLPTSRRDWIRKLGALCGLLGITTAQRRRRERSPRRRSKWQAIPGCSPVG